MSTAAELLAELSRRGIDLWPDGDRLLFLLRDAMTPDLADRVEAHKSKLLAVLRAGDAIKECLPQPAQGGQNRPTVAATPGAGRIARPDAPACGNPPDAPHELSLAERVESGYVSPGWTSAAWAHRLQQLADRCEAIRPELAAQYRTWAANVAKKRESTCIAPSLALYCRWWIMSFRKVIQAEVKRQGLSGYRVAKVSGVPMRTVQAYLAEDCDLTGERVARIAKALGLGLRPVRRTRKGR